jgi:chromosome segregation ATPase
MEVFHFLECCQTGKPTPLLRSELVRLQQQPEDQQQQQHEVHHVEQQVAALLQKGKKQQQQQQQQPERQQQQQKNAGMNLSWSEVTYEGMKEPVPGVQGGAQQ